MIEIFSREKERIVRLLLPGVPVLVLVATILTLVGAGPLRAQAPSDETEVGGGLYLFHHQPVDLEDAESLTEVYAAFVTVDHRTGPWRVHAQARARDTPLREFFPGNVWLQEAWASYRVAGPGPRGRLTLRAGKMYQTLGRFWDGSFFGNVHYFDGLKLNPQFGLEAAGSADAGRVALGWSAQLLLSSDWVSGSIQGRDFETLEGHKDQYGVTGRLTAGLPGGVTLGASALSRRFEGSAPGRPGRDAWRVLHLSVDGQVHAGPLLVYGEATLRGDGDLPRSLLMTQPGSEATYWLAGAQYLGERVHLRYNFSLVDYESLDRREWIHQPGVTVELSENLSGLFEVDLWERDEEEGGSTTVDRSLNFILLLRF